LEELIYKEAERKKEEDNKPKKRGRPRLSDEEKAKRAKEKEDKKSKKKHKKVSKKNKKKNLTKKGTPMIGKNKIKVPGKRGRKASVGKVVLDFINKRGTANIDDIYSVYSKKLVEMDKVKSVDDQRRNLYSTLFILNRDKKIVTLEKRNVYGSAK